MRALLKDRAGLLVLVIALVVHAATLAHFWQDNPFARHLVLDAHRYDSLARDIVAGGFPAREPFHQAPLYPHLVAIVYTISGGSTLALFVVQSLVGAAAAFLLYRLGRRYFGRSAGLAAGLMGIFCQPLLAFSPRVLPTVLIVFMELLLLDRIPHDEDERARSWILPGIVGGLLCIARPTHLLLIPWAIGAAIFTHRPGYRGLAAFLVPILLIVAPVTVHNATHGAGLVLVSSNGGETFYHGNNPRAAGGYSLMAGLESADILKQAEVSRAIAESRTGRTMTAADVSRYWFGEGIAFIRENPGRYARLELQKIRMMLGGEEAPDIYSPAFEASAYTPLYRAGIARFPLTLPLVIAGVALLGRRMPRWLLALIFVNALTLLAFYVSNRYRLPLEVLALLPAAYALTRIRERRAQILIVPGLALMLLLFATSHPERVREARAKVLVNLGTSLGKSRDYPEAERVFRRAIEQDPSWARAHHYLGRTLALQRRNDAAITAYQRAADLAPDAFDVRLDLIRALRRGGRQPEARRQLAALDSLATTRGERPLLEQSARLWLTLERPDRAAEVLERLTADAPNDASLWERLGVAHGLAGDPAAARAALERSVALDAASPGAWAALVRTLAELDLCDEARERLEEALLRSGAAAGEFHAIRAEISATCSPQR